MIRSVFRFIVGAALFVLTIAIGGCGPSTYEDCILRNVKPSMVKSAVFAVKQACRVKFPLKQSSYEVFKEFADREMAKKNKND